MKNYYELWMTLIHMSFRFMVVNLQQSSPAPFRVIWNSPTYVCQLKHNVTIPLGKYGIESNPDQAWQGSKMAVFYQTIFGKWPLYLNLTYKQNGGIPQRGDINLHLDTIRKNLSRLLPNINFSGIGVVDMEAYLPLWNLMRRARHNQYIQDSITYFNETFDVSAMNKSTYLGKLAESYENTTKLFFTRTMHFVQLLRPNGLWGYFGYPRCARIYKTYKCDKRMKRYNEEMLWFYAAQTAYFPALYLNRIYIPNPMNRARHMIQLMNEGLRMSKLATNGITPVYPYARYSYENENYVYLKYEDLKNTITQSADMAQAGLVFWGDYSDFGNCTMLAQYVDTMLGPMASAAINFAKICSQTVCNGNGRCIRKEFADQGILKPEILKPYHNQLYIEIVRPNSTLENLYTCVCYPQWQGDICDQPNS